MSAHPSLPVDAGAIEEIAANLDLRVPNAEALTAIATALAAADGEPVEVVIDVATAVGKTYVAAGLVDYAASQGVRNFAVIAPSRSILRKTIANFTPGNPKEVRGRATTPVLITSEDFTSGSVRAALEDATAVKLFVFTVQQLIKPTDKTSRRVREFQEGLGEGLYDYLKSADDLMIIADEHHSYFGAQFSKAVRDLDAMVIVGLTATVDPKTPKGEIIYSYPLGRAIADGLVKAPVLVGRKDDRRDLETQLLDGVALLNVKRAAIRTYCDRHGLDPINPVMFIVCQTISDADEVAEILKRPSFFGADYDKAVLTVHSEAGDAALDALALVEEPDSPVRAIVSVSMLKEGWDVKNIYVICALRALASQVLTEQTLGRGLRLPFGKLTEIEMLDTVEVLAHDRYEELLARAGALTRSLIGNRLAEAVDAKTGMATVVEGDPASAAELVSTTTADLVLGDGTTPVGSEIPGVVGPVIRVADTEARRAAIEREELSMRQVVAIPVGTEPFYVPVVKTLPRPKTFSLSKLKDEDFERLGATLAASPEDVLRRNRIEVVKTPAGGYEIKTVPAEDKVTAAVPQLDLEQGTAALVEEILNQGLVTANQAEKNAAERLAEAFVRGLGSDAQRRLSAFFNTAMDTIRSQLAASYESSPADFEIVVSERPLEVSRTNTRPVTSNLYEIVDRTNPAAYQGWSKSLVALEWFDSDTERQMAVLLDESEAIKRWVRLHRGDVVISYRGRNYNPDFAAEDADGVCWLLEVKADKDLDAADVLSKRAAAEEWARYASDHLKPRKWIYTLASETDLKHAKGNWALLLAQAGAR